MKSKYLILPILVIFACGSGAEEQVTGDEMKDTVNVEAMNPESGTADEAGEETTAPVPEVAAEASSIEAYEKKAGGLSFCDCIKKQKELDDKMMATDDDAEVEQLLAESEKLREGECKVLKAGPQMTAAEKKERERKVQECLGNK